MRHGLGVGGVLGLACLLACDPNAEPPPDVQSAEQPIVGGTRAAACQWPTAVGIDGCTGTLVHPRVVTTAGHCLEEGDPPEITFGERWAAGAVRRARVERCFHGADSGVEGDFGFCVLAEAVTDVPIVPVLYGCETAALVPGATATLAGYGRRGGLSFSAGVKYAVDVQLGRIVANDIYVGSARMGACHGDSGGPAYLRLADGSWRVFGATSRGTFFCNSQTIYTLIHPFVPWLERESGIDVTPCHAADGTWEPGPGCGGFPTDPFAPGSWSNMCQHQQRSGAGASCGDPGGSPI